jgi:hypothetical protein
MSRDENGSYVIPTLLAGAALYFGLNKKSNVLADITQAAVERTIRDQTSRNCPKQLEPAVTAATQVRPLRRHRRRK